MESKEECSAAEGVSRRGESYSSGIWGMERGRDAVGVWLDRHSWSWSRVVKATLHDFPMPNLKSPTAYHRVNFESEVPN